uniref:Cleavage/polyadenylation specificity factor A subunit C-terminal domain-containing protein n=1 Tax=Panagrolaimus sp. PS1159 TaxID=55785 RepID=A0AC35GJV8_9BILA
MFPLYKAQIPYNIVDVKSIGGRIVVSDVQESIHFLRYRSSDNRIVVFADETTPRYVRATCILDYDTVAVGDRFGNISIVGLYFILHRKSI